MPMRKVLFVSLFVFFISAQACKTKKKIDDPLAARERARSLSKLTKALRLSEESVDQQIIDQRQRAEQSYPKLSSATATILQALKKSHETNTNSLKKIRLLVEMSRVEKESLEIDIDEIPQILTPSAIPDTKSYNDFSKALDTLEDFVQRRNVLLEPKFPYIINKEFPFQEKITDGSTTYYIFQRTLVGTKDFVHIYQETKLSSGGYNADFNLAEKDKDYPVWLVDGNFLPKSVSKLIRSLETTSLSEEAFQKNMESIENDNAVEKLIIRARVAATGK